MNHPYLLQLVPYIHKNPIGAGIKVEDMKKPGRKQPEAAIRQRAMARMYREGYGPKEIGTYFNRSKGTVSGAVEKYIENE